MGSLVIALLFLANYIASSTREFASLVLFICYFGTYAAMLSSTMQPFNILKEPAPLPTFSMQQATPLVHVPSPMMQPMPVYQQAHLYSAPAMPRKN